MKTVFVLLTLVLSVSQGFQNTYPSSCKELYQRYPSLPSGVYDLQVASTVVPVYCHMGDFGCGCGGWTTVMKIDGRKQTFIYDSDLWTNLKTYNLERGQTGFDESETKLKTYWRTPFTKICLGMKINGIIRFVVINKQASSLENLIFTGDQYIETSLGRDTWKKLIGRRVASLQTGCSREGFNVKQVAGWPHVVARARIGIIADDNSDCVTPDSRIGFGTGGHHAFDNSCGNDAPVGKDADNGEVHIKAMGYILVQ